MTSLTKDQIGQFKQNGDFRKVARLMVERGHQISPEAIGQWYNGVTSSRHESAILEAWTEVIKHRIAHLTAAVRNMGEIREMVAALPVTA